MSAAALHFGAGALGRALVLPRLHAAGHRLAVVDTDVALVDRLRADGGYRLVVADASRATERFVRVEHAFVLGRDDVGLNAAIAEAELVSTSVRVGNLAAVVERLGAVWRGEPGRVRHVLGCENAESIGALLDGLFERSAPEVSGKIRCPDCVVDRISAIDPDGRTAHTEPYHEWVVEAASGGVPPGPDVAHDVAPLFHRKRYLVNAVADACAFLGAADGLDYLHKAVADARIRASIEPFVALVLRHLERRFDLSPDALVAYRARCLERLGNPAIGRRLDTVARDPWRKFGADERFLTPVLERAAAGDDVGPALEALAGVMLAVEPDAATLRTRLDELWAGTDAQRFADIVDRAARRGDRSTGGR